ncbi:MAG: family 1 glycosylhydrolase [Chloroflexota bacterium]|nr:family 1 glycosylhydrolase [Chloroflexota bacterium]
MNSDARFRWAVGIEDTFIPQLRTRTGRTLDEYELTDHYAQWRDDLGLAADVGADTMRYGIPWYRVNPAPGRFDWEWTDAVVEHLVGRLRITPIIDLMHYGTPLWLERQFVNPDYPQRVAEYAHAVADRYRDQISWYTPLNEPRINARLCGLNGTWPPYLRGWPGYVRMTLALARGISLAIAAIREAVPNATIVQVEATEAIRTADPSLHDEQRLQQEHQYLATDVVLGRVDERHPLSDWLSRHGAPDDDLAWLRSHAQQVDVLGINYYPELSPKTLVRTGERVVRRRGGGWTAELEQILTDWHARYGRPLMITETSAIKAVRGRLRWLDASVGVVAEARRGGLPVIGYTWWPLFSLVAWAYRGGRKPVASYFAHMGLWDLRPDNGTLRRVRTPVADRFAAIVREGAQ